MSIGSDVIVGAVSLVLVPLIAWRIVRGLRDGHMPIYRTYLNRADGPAKFGALLALHALSLLLVAAIAADLLLNLGLRNAL